MAEGGIDGLWFFTCFCRTNKRAIEMKTKYSNFQMTAWRCRVICGQWKVSTRDIAFASIYLNTRICFVQDVRLKTLNGCNSMNETRKCNCSIYISHLHWIRNKYSYWWDAHMNTTLCIYAYGRRAIAIRTMQNFVSNANNKFMADVELYHFIRRNL